MSTVSKLLACAALAVVIILGGCAAPSKIAELETRVQSLEERLKRAEGLESDVAAVRGYARDVQKQIVSLRDLTARELDNQNAHITRVKAAYAAVLEQHIQMVGTMDKTIDSMMADLKTTLSDGVKTLRQALRSSDEAVPPAPPLPPRLGGTTSPAKTAPAGGKTAPTPVPDSLKKAPGGQGKAPPAPAK